MFFRVVRAREKSVPGAEPEATQPARYYEVDPRSLHNMFARYLDASYAVAERCRRTLGRNRLGW
jgi:hypothetical protein